MGSTSPNGNATDGASSKKRKLEDEPGGVNGETKKLSREERREAKRSRKWERKQGNGTHDLVEDIKSVRDEEDRKIAKSARKAEKQRLKAERKAQVEEAAGATEELGNGEKNGDVGPVHEGSKMDKKAAKEARRLEKALKKLKRSEEGESTATTSVEAPEDGNGSEPKKSHKISGAAQGYAEESALASLPQDSIDSFWAHNHITIVDTSTNERPSHRPIIAFKYLPKTLGNATEESPFSSFMAPTPVQAAAWPHLLAGRDVVGVAETGSGKTLAFGVPCIRAITAMETSSKRSPARAVVVSPTRELAAQIHAQLEILATPASLRTVCIYGGIPKDEQRQALKKAHIIVATPGRLNDLIEEGVADLSQVKYLVLDEADRMLDTGFEEAIRTIISHTPSSTSGRQTCMFTATWPQSVRTLAATFMTTPIHITIGANNPTGELRANKSITQIIEVIDPLSKEGRLRELVKEYAPRDTYSIKRTKSTTDRASSTKNNRLLVFCLYKKEAARLEAMLRKTLSGSEIAVAGIHGDMSQPLRTASLNAFKKGDVSVLVATDVAARGLDIPDVKVVINVTFPLTVEDYVHRIGRTGRAGKEGVAYTLFTEHDKALAGGLINVLKAAEQEVPEELLRFGTTVKRKVHESYGNFYREVKEGEKSEGTKIRFD